MNPNRVNHFSSAAVGINRQRSTFDRPQKVLSTFNSGYLVPISWDAVLPGDNYLTKLNGVVRSLTPVFPTLDNSYLDIYAFYVPNRIIWKHWVDLMGENNSTTNPWLPATTYQVPQLTINGGMRSISSNTPTDKSVLYTDLLSYLGIPVMANASGSVSVSQLPIRAYCKIWNDFFRDENLQTPINFFYDSDSTESYSYISGGAGIYDAVWQSYVNKGACLAPVDKYKDYFSSALPAPQRGAAVNIPLGDFAPVITRSVGSSTSPSGAAINQTVGLSWAPINNSSIGSTGSIDIFGSVASNTSALRSISTVSNSSSNSITGSTQVLAPNNLYVDLSEATSASINQLRMAIASQHYLETIARSGSRYIEILYSLYGVKSSDARLQRSEYLGGKRIPLNITQTVSTNGDVANGNLGDTGAYSLTGFSEELSNHFFEEHGIFMVLCCIRTDNSYAQGIEKEWFKKDRFDFYAPCFANLGEMPIYVKELRANGDSSDDLVFGYQEAWAEHRYKPNLALSYFNPAIGASGDLNCLSSYSYVNYFNNIPMLNASFIRFDKDRVTQTLAADSSPYQYIADFYLENKTTRVMPMYSVPGLQKI